jgi:hypothetical protein
MHAISGVWLAGALMLATALLMTQREWLVWPIGALWAACNVLVWRLRCANCGARLALRWARIGPLRIPWYWGLPSECEGCGRPIV